jgi:hypothetical protein
MNRSISKLLILIFFFCTTLVANAGPFGLGVIIGEPTGISMKFWNSKTSAIDGAIAWSFEDESALHLHADYLLHAFNLINVSKGDLPLYYGLGVRLKLQEEDQLGIRIPLGMAYYFENAPLDIFFELVPILELVPSTEIAFNAAIGIRYFF